MKNSIREAGTPIQIGEHETSRSFGDPHAVIIQEAQSSYYEKPSLSSTHKRVGPAIDSGIGLSITIE